MYNSEKYQMINKFFFSKILATLFYILLRDNIYENKT